MRTDEKVFLILTRNYEDVVSFLNYQLGTEKTQELLIGLNSILLQNQFEDLVVMLENEKAEEDANG